jgi:predicted CopG family antitoxin
MGYALRKIEPEPRSYSERIRELVEADKVEGARRLLAEALGGHHDEDLSGWQRVLAKTKGRPSPEVELDFDRTPEVTWIREKSALYRGQWVALLGDELLAHSKSLDEVVAILKENKPPRRALLHYII